MDAQASSLSRLAGSRIGRVGAAVRRALDQVERPIKVLPHSPPIGASLPQLPRNPGGEH